MKYHSYRYEFTGKELIYFLFKKKTCPLCGSIMERSKEYEVRPGSDFQVISRPELVDNRRVKLYIYYYTCKNCNKKYPLSVLAK